MRATSSGCEVIVSPWRANRITTVNKSPYSAQGASLGRKRLSYHSTPLVRSPHRRVR